MTAAEASDLLDVLIRKAPGLRTAGVLALELGEVKVQLMPHHDDAPKNAQQATQSGDPFKDPATYGRGMGEQLPGYEFEPDE